MVGGSERIIGNFKVACFDIDGNDFAALGWINLGTHLALIDLRAAPRVLFLAVTWLP